MRIVLVGIFWSIFFLEGIRVIMLTNWRFDILQIPHWHHAWNLWMNGWVIIDPKEWAFVMIILTFIPLWLTGWAALSMVRWGRLLGLALVLPLKIFNHVFEKPVKIIANTASVKVVKKKKSYKEIRPISIRPPIEGSSYNKSPSQGRGSNAAPQRLRAPIESADKDSKKPTAFEHSLFQMDDGISDDFDFDLFEDKPQAAPVVVEAPVVVDENKGKNKNKGKNNSNKNQTPVTVPAPTPAAQPANNRPNNNSNSTFDVLKQKGYEVITGITIRNTLIDFIGVADNQICLCLNDKEPGDWLADEERFNDEEPLWFSESSHRISPVRKVDIARLILNEKLSDADMKFTIEAYVIEQIGNIINAEDMFEIWDGMKINVTRIDRGTPKELKLFAKALNDANASINRDKLEKVKKIIRSIA